MFNLMFFSYSLLFYFLYFFLGIGLVIFILPRTLRKYTVLFAPIVGYCLSSWLTWFFCSLNFGGTDDYYYWILLSGVSIFVFAIVKSWKQKISSFFSKDLIVPILISVMAFVVISLPSLIHQDMSCLTIGNHDLFGFSNMSRSAMSGAGVAFPYWGTSASTALFCSVMQLDPYQVQMISLYVFFVIALLLTYVVAKEIFLYTNFGSNAIVILFGLSSIFYNCIYNGFERQIIAVSVILLLFMSNIFIIRSQSWRESITYFPLLFVAFWGLFITYDFMIFILYGVIATYVALNFLINRNISVYWLVINIILIICYWITSFNVSYYVALISGAYNDVIGGWFVQWVSLPKLFGIVPFFKNVVSYRDIISLIFITVIIIWGLIKLYKVNKDVFSLSLSIFSSVFLIAFAVSYDSWGKGVFGSYYQMKLFTTFLPLLFLSSLCIFSGYTWNTIKRSIVLGALFLLIMFNCLSAGLFIFESNEEARFVYVETIGLKTVNDNVVSINIPEGELWRVMWETYFLYPKRIHYDDNQNYVMMNSHVSSPLGDWSLIRNDYLFSDIYVNSTYSLRRASE